MPKTRTTELQHALSDLFAEMQTTDKGSEEYANLAKQVAVLYPLQDHDTKSKAHRVVSTEALLTIAANLLGIGIIVGFERTAVITSKALPLVKKLF